MPYISCPTGLVNAPIDVVWNLLTDPAGWTAFFDIRVTRIDPPGPAVVGQRIWGESGPRILRLVVTFEYTEIDAARRTLGLNIQLPLGITVRENLSCSAVGDIQCRVNYHCDFSPSNRLARGNRTDDTVAGIRGRTSRLPIAAHARCGASVFPRETLNSPRRSPELTAPVTAPTCSGNSLGPTPAIGRQVPFL
jgi:hypothetical protein